MYDREQNKYNLCTQQLQVETYNDCQLPPNAEQTKAYRDYLTKKGFSPVAITNQFSEENKLVLVEYTASARGLFSFLNFMKQWAKEIDPALETKLEKSISIHLLLFNDQKFYFKSLANAFFNSDYFYGFSLTRQFLSPILLTSSIDGEHSDNTRSVGVAEAHDFPDLKETTFGSSYKVTSWGTTTPVEMNQEDSYGLYLTRMAFVDRLYKRGMLPNLSNTTEQCVSSSYSFASKKLQQPTGSSHTNNALSQSSAASKSLPTVSIQDVVSNAQHFLQLANYALNLFFKSEHQTASAAPLSVSKDNVLSEQPNEEDLKWTYGISDDESVVDTTPDYCRV